MFGFEKIDLSFSISPLIFLAGLIVLGIYTFYIYRYTVPPVSPSKKVLLVLIRFTALLLLLFIVFEPILTLAKKDIIEPVNLIFVDNSRSIKIDDGTAREEKVRNFIEDADRNLGNISEFAVFGSTIRSVSKDSLDFINFNDGSTNFSNMIDNLSQREENISSIILISDGVITSGSNPVFTAERLNIPFYTVGVGDTVGRNDIEIRNVLFNEYIYAESPTSISASIRNKGFSNRKISAVLFEDNKQIALQELQLSEMDNISFTYTPETGGEKKLTLTISELDGEFTHVNNKRVFYVNVLDNKLNVLLISGAPSSDLTFIKNSLSLDENLKISSITQVGQNKYIEEGNHEQKIDSADIIFLIGFPAAQTNNELLRKTADAVQNKNIPYFLVFTEYIDPGKLKILEKDLGFSIGRYTPRLNEVFSFVSASNSKNPLLQNNSVNPVEAWNKLPPVLQPDGEFRPKPESEVLASVKINNVPVNTPLIISRKLGEKRSVTVLAQNIWRWKLQTATKELDLFDRFIMNSVKWLNTREDQKQVDITTTKKVYPAGEEVEFNAQVYDETFNPIADAEVEVLIKGGGKEFEVLLSAVGNGLYEGTFHPETTGDYSFKGTAVREDKKIGEDQGKFNIGEIDLEMANSAMNIEMLSSLASSTGGSFFKAGEHQDLFNIVKSLNAQSSREKSNIKELDLWADERLLILVILLLGTEWFIRKRTGML